MTDPEGKFDWAVPDEEVLADINAEARTIGTYLYGQRMYETMTGWETNPAFAAQSPVSAEFATILRAVFMVIIRGRDVPGCAGGATS